MRDKLYNKLIDQINIELSASYKYFGIAQYLEFKNLDGLKEWYLKQSAEEKEHAEKIIAHLNDVGMPIKLKAIEAVETDYAGVADALQETLKSEKFVSHCFRELYEIAQAEKEYESIPLILFFLEEQIEEEKTVQDLIYRLEQYQKELAPLRLDKFVGMHLKS